MKHMKISSKWLLLWVFCTLLNFNAALAQQNSAYQQYIQKYSSLAIDQMNRHSIPASITLAQGLLESGAGRSTLATQAHNHFGIKVSTGWTGPYIVRDDDAKGEHFRKYNTDAESFEDHSLFLKKQRYASLFALDIKDYKGWARGLKAAGYATNPAYAESLIRIIETYQLHQYDNGQLLSSVSTSRTGSEEDIFYQTHRVQQCNNNYYIILQSGDNIDDVARILGIKKRKLLSYNDLPSDYSPNAGSVIFLKKKRTKADKFFKNHPHVLLAGQSLYDVSQIYGIRLKNLYKLNGFTPDYVPLVGQQIRVY